MLSSAPRVTRKAPGCLLFLVDQSSSMAQTFVGSEHKKSDAVAATINEVIYRLALNCAPLGEVWDYYHLGAIGYGRTVELAFEGKLSGLGIIPISQVAASPRRIVSREFTQDGQTIESKQPEWITPKAAGPTPMVAAIKRARELVEDWVTDFPDSVPPIVMNLSDGEASDGEPKGEASKLVATETSVGPVMFFNLQLTTRPTAPVLYPSSPDSLEDEFARALFEMSSTLPGYLVDVASGMGIPIDSNGRGFCANANMTTLVDFLTIGSTPANMR